MKKSPVHRGAVKGPQRAAVRVGKNSLRPKLISNEPKPPCNFIQRLIPGNPLKRGLCGSNLCRFRLCGADTLVRVRSASCRPLSSNPPHRIKHPPRRINPIQILSHLSAKKPARYRMLRIPLNLGSAPFLDRNQNAASIRTIMRTSSMDNPLHPPIIRRKIRRRTPAVRELLREPQCPWWLTNFADSGKIIYQQHLQPRNRTPPHPPNRPSQTGTSEYPPHPSPVLSCPYRRFESSAE